MHDENDFLRAVMENPADDTIRMVFADWLDERGDDESQAKAKFLRVTVRLMGPIKRVGWRERPAQGATRTRPGAAAPRGSRSSAGCAFESCPVAKAKAAEVEMSVHGIRFVVCDRRWDELTATADPTVRHCDACQKNVHYCDTIDAARAHAHRGECVAVSLGVIRYGNDLEQPTGAHGRRGWHHLTRVLESPMHDDNDFLRKLLENPADDTRAPRLRRLARRARRRREQAKAQFLRLTVRLLEPSNRSTRTTRRK